MGKAQKKYKKSKRGRFNERVNKRLRNWIRVYGCETDIDFDEIVDVYSDCEGCQYCGAKGVKLLLHLNDNTVDIITLNEIDFICQECLYESIARIGGFG